ncbi:MAG: hypothetical protein AAF927_31875 [Bacteroidota bacterium]
MQRLLSRLVPVWLRQFDRKLLLRSPHIWATKVHYVAYTLLIIYTLATLWTAMVPLSLQNATYPHWYLIMPIPPLLVVFAYWVYRVSLFKRSKQFGEADSQSRWQEQATYLLVIAMFCAIPLSLNFQHIQRLGNLVSDETLAAEINHLNTAYNFFRGLDDDERCSYDSWCFDRFNPYIKLAVAMKDENENRALFQEWIEGSSQAQEALINEYIRILNKYHYVPFAIESNFVLDNFHNQPYRDFDENYSQTELLDAESRTAENIKLISFCKAGKNHFLQPEYVLYILGFMLWSLIALMLFFKLGARIFWLAMGISTLAVFVLNLISSLLVGLLSFNISIVFVVLLVVLVALFARYSLKAKKTPKLVQLAIGLLIGPLLFSPFLVLKMLRLVSIYLISESIYFGELGYMLATLAGPILVLILWNWSLEKRLSNLEASPKSR